MTKYYNVSTKTDDWVVIANSEQEAKEYAIKKGVPFADGITDGDVWEITDQETIDFINNDEILNNQ